MSKNALPTSKPDLFLKFLSLIVPVLALAGAISCGGGSSNRPGGGGGGGGGGADCKLPLPVNSSPSAQGGVGKQVPSTFMDLHVGSSNLVSTVTVPYGGLRLWDTATGWAQINTASGVYDWSNLDGFVSALPPGHDLLYNLARTPAWISKNPSDTTCSYSTSAEGGPGQCQPPSDLNSDGTGTDAAWIKWVSAVASRYKGQIKYYEIWNEWNAKVFWVGTPAQLVRMEQDARCVVDGPPAGSSCNPGSTFPSGTAIDPGAKIVSPSPVGAAGSMLSSVKDNLNTYFGTSVSGHAGGEFADIIGFHGYVSTGKSGTCPVPEDVVTVIDDMNSAITSAPGETGKPWFNTEDGWSKAAEEGFLDQDRESAFMARYELLQWSMGVDRGYWYRWDSTVGYQGALWTNSTGPIQAVSTWDEVSKWMVGATLSTACTVKGTVWQCGFTRSGGYAALAVWDSSQDCLKTNCPTTAFTPPAGGYTLYRDLTGKENSISGSVLIGAKPVLLETSKLP
ncbi:MAG: hypothetical protein DMG79_06500 [Acidobacteria bacterium]|nr:MAG: hypothetical protein DMG79_06500 [Acidobacteriota bacterium]